MNTIWYTTCFGFIYIYPNICSITSSVCLELAVTIVNLKHVMILATDHLTSTNAVTNTTHKCSILLTQLVPIFVLFYSLVQWALPLVDKHSFCGEGA